MVYPARMKNLRRIIYQDTKPANIRQVQFLFGQTGVSVHLLYDAILAVKLIIVDDIFLRGYASGTLED
jgi:hypothetical protein